MDRFLIFGSVPVPVCEYNTKYGMRVLVVAQVLDTPGLEPSIGAQTIQVCPCIIT